MTRKGLQKESRECYKEKENASKTRIFSSISYSFEIKIRERNLDVCFPSEKIIACVSCKKRPHAIYFQKIKLGLVSCIVALVSALTSFLAIPPVGAEPLSPPVEAQITVKIDKDLYNRGDFMIISGEVKSVVTNVPLTIQVLDPDNNLVHVEQILVASDGRF